MIVKLCPLCDSEMKKAHYCDVCHSFVWKPQIMDIHYNTDTRGMGEVDCAYGETHDELDHHMPKAKEWHKQFDRKKVVPEKSRRQSGEPEEKKNKNLVKIIAIIIALITIVDMMASCLTGIAGIGAEKLPFDKLENLVEVHDEAEADETSQDGQSYKEIEDVSAYTDGCSEYGHFDTGIDDIRTGFIDWLREFSEQRDLDTDSIFQEEDTYNYTYEMSDGDHVVLNSYLYAGFEDEPINWEFNYDSVTGQLHGVTVWYAPEEDIRGFFDFLMPQLALTYDDWKDIAMDDMFTLPSEEGQWYEYDGASFYIQCLEKEDADGNALYTVSVMP